jgi:ribosome maturation factor RimP
MQDQITKMAQQFAEQVKTAVPEVKFNKNGYEIRTQVLDMAKQFTEFEYATKFQGWEMKAERDEKTGQVVTSVAMPEVPGVDKVLETAEKFYNFVNNSYSK